MSGGQVYQPLSLSVFTIEADRKPIVVFAAKKHEDADAFFRDETFRTNLRLATSGGIALCDGYSILRLRMANSTERARYREIVTTWSSGNPIFLVEVDGGD